MKLSKIVEKESIAAKWVQEQGLVPTKLNCPYCRNELTVKARRLFGQFRCDRDHGKHGSFKMSATKNTFFENSKLPVGKVLRIVYCFAHEYSYRNTEHECTDDSTVLSAVTIAEWFSYLREVCMDVLERKYEKHTKLGGPGHIVEIDECLIGHKKYRSGKAVEGNWVLGMIDRDTEEIRMEVCPNNKRDADTLVTLIKKHVHPETTIMTDCWKGYAGLSKENFKHLVVNRALHFVDPSSGACTNTIQSQWRTLRHRMSRGGVRNEELAMHLCEFLWRRDCYRMNKDPFSSIIEGIKMLCPGGPNPPSDISSDDSD